MFVDQSIASQLSADAIRDLQAHTLGEVLQPEDADYASARGVWNAAADYQPRVIVCAADAADVIRTVNFARQHSLSLAIRSGGHGFAGHGSGDGVVLDLSTMRGV